MDEDKWASSRWVISNVPQQVCKSSHILAMKNNLSSALRRAASTLTKDVGDISSVFPSLSGKKPDPLPPRFSDLKKSLIKGNEDAVVASWQRLTMSLRREIEELKAERSNVCGTPLLDNSRDH